MKNRHIDAKGPGASCAQPCQSSARIANGKRLKCAALACSLAALSCNPAPPVPQADETPEREFILERFHFEERRNGQLLWHGHAARGTGDISTSDVTAAELTRVPQQLDEMPLHIRADVAHLALADGLAHFQPLFAFDGCGRTLQGSAADYDEATATLHADGPIRITTPQGHLDAVSATLAIDAGQLVLEGPILGRFVPTALQSDATLRALPTPHTPAPGVPHAP